MRKSPAATPTKDSALACCTSDGRPLPPGEAARAAAARVFRALGDATRVEIFALIASRPEAICVCDITAKFDLTQPTISHHLKVLRGAGLVSASKRGTWAYYAVDPRGVRAARAVVDAVLPAERSAARR